jgi:very-short-patch-repair endonuclease
VNPLLAALLSAQHGLVTPSAARKLGITDAQLSGMVARGDLVRMHRGVYRHVAAPITLEQRIRAGLLAVGPAGTLSHRSALARHGVHGFDCQLVEVTHRSLALPIREGMIVHRSRVVAEPDIQRQAGVMTTTPARTVIDSAAVMSPRLVARYAQEWMANRLLRPDDLDDALTRAGNHRGAHLLRRHMADTIVGADSAAEARLGQILIHAGLKPVLHLLVTTQHGHTFELDWAYPEARLGLEMDGYGVHLRSSVAFDDDRFRRNELEIAGWKILNFTVRQCHHPARVVGQVRRALIASSSL